LNFFVFLMNEYMWEQALLFAYLDAGNMKHYFLDVCKIYIEKLVKTGYISELLVRDFLQSQEGQNFIQTYTGYNHYLKATFEQLQMDAV
jgi:hypothetical protein